MDQFDEHFVIFWVVLVWGERILAFREERSHIIDDVIQSKSIDLIELGANREQSLYHS